jgi:signal transduction histidine kinase
VEQQDDRSKGIGGAVIVSIDISDLKEAEMALKRAFDERSRLRASETAAKEASRMKSDWAQNISHEIRAPISGILGMAELVLDDKSLSGEVRDGIQKITKSAGILLHMVNNVLVSRADCPQACSRRFWTSDGV